MCRGGEGIVNRSSLGHTQILFGKIEKNLKDIFMKIMAM
ncbi:hypothetical protein NLO413_0207 [Candidatus Neoehrlichia lotoris str. RAC413]|uniref:Uncharacterized protein n=1 Tax=Candidatus Neoehrlichia procyonis str. RAC413 TaxID=1359163 RepID=A0A0F3NM32_9RICK|nr:hypothetical protein NLO413_0207 [Candidatus Neoehrlichia lotoris str. RAC413]